jgi:photosystem II stability/assembly factor-like uncharacterized protein
MRAPSFRSASVRSLLVALAFGLTAWAVAAPAAAGWRSEGPLLGAVSDLAVDPAHPDTVYAATSGGGVWRSDDFGRSWSLPGDGLTGWSVRWVEVDPATPATLWAGVDATGVPSLWRSRDRGASWERVTDAYKGGRLAPVGQRIAFAPSQPAQIWVPSTNLHYRSRDGGKSWSDFRVPGQDAYAIAVDPKNADLVYAGGRGESWNLSRSTDGGKTWKPAGKGLEGSVAVLAVDPEHPATLYAVTGFHDLYKSDDGGATFALLPLPVEGTDALFRLRLDPAYPEVLWAATAAGLLRSNDGGRHWSPSERGTGRYLARAVAFDPRDTRRMLAACAGDGVYRSDDAGATWAPSREGLAAGWVERLYGAPAASTLFAQTSTGLWRRPAGGGWSEVQQPFEESDEVKLDGVIFDRRAAQGVWAFDASRAWRSADGGQRWEEVKVKEPSLRDLMKGNLGSVQFRSLVQDPGDPKVLYAGSWSNDAPGSAVYKTTDAAKSWKPSGKGLPGEAVTLLRSEKTGVVFALVDDHDLFRSGDGGASWAPAGAGLPEGKVRDLAIDPSAPARLYLAGEHGFFRSTDDGASWSRVGGALEREDVEAVAVAADGRVFAGAFHGVFSSADGGGAWTAMNDGLAVRDVRALAIAGPPPARLYAGTAGGSVWSTELP